MPHRLDFAKDLLYFPRLVDDESGPHDPHHFLAIHILFFPNIVSFRDLLILVAKQRVRQRLIHLESSLSLGRILGYAKHHGALLLKLLVDVAELASFHGAARSTG